MLKERYDDMQKVTLFFALAFFAACSSFSVPESSTGEPDKAEKKIVMAWIENCSWCDKQKSTIKRMQKNGELQGVKVEYQKGSSSIYPAKLFPTTWICVGSKCYPPHSGAMSREMILKRLK